MEEDSEIIPILVYPGWILAGSPFPNLNYGMLPSFQVGDGGYHTGWNKLHHASQKYSKLNEGLNYWNSLLQIHTALGLSYT